MRDAMRVALGLLLATMTVIPGMGQTRPRGRDLGIPFPGQTGSDNARVVKPCASERPMSIAAWYYVVESNRPAIPPTNFHPPAR